MRILSLLSLVAVVLLDASCQGISGGSGDTKRASRGSGKEKGSPAGFVTIPAGTFTMGSPSDEPGRLSGETQHAVTLTRNFFLQRTEVTWAQWNKVRDWALKHGYADLPAGRNGHTGDPTGTHPVTEVDWPDVVKWLNAWSEKDGLTPCYTVAGSVMKTGRDSPLCNFNASGYRLPTEAEWEYACRAGTPGSYAGVLDDMAWYANNSGRNLLDASALPIAERKTYARRLADNGCVTHVVGAKSPNAWGLYDMHGNVFEWCWDVYGKYPAGAVSDPTGLPTGPSDRSIRGGGWGDTARLCRSAFRGRTSPDNGHFGRGFRPARSSVP